jgi:Flp pilus assembly protein TadD
MSRVVVHLIVVALLTGACAAKQPVRSVKTLPGARRAAATHESHESLESFIDKVRAKSERAQPVAERARTIEITDPVLASELKTLTLEPTAANHRIVAAAYVRHGVLDLAHEHFSAAVALDPTDGASWDGLARIWRDWGFAHLALPDAYRAVYFVPDSPAAHNTLGTVLQAMGRTVDARAQFEQALALDVNAAYALSNLCYGWRLEGNPARAADACRDALKLRPDLQSARNNLALAYEAEGNLSAAVETIAASADKARAAYNEGLLHLAGHRYRDALNAFERARAARPQYRAAEIMARRVRAQLTGAASSESCTTGCAREERQQ